MSTIDSFVQKFGYKQKKFSFRGNSQDNNDENEEENKNKSDDDSEVEDKQKKVLKGSAKLKAKKDSDSSYKNSSEEDDDDDSEVEAANKKKKSRILKPKNSDSDDTTSSSTSTSISDNSAKDKELKRIYTLFPAVDETKIKKTFKNTKYNAKQCIDILLEDGGDDQKDADDENEEIDEWSDGDEAIRERNRVSKETTNRSQNSHSLKTSSESSSSLTSNGSATNKTSNNRKRKLSSDTENVKKTNKKKQRRVIIDSEEDEESSRSSDRSTRSKTKVDSSQGSSSKENRAVNHNNSTLCEENDNVDDSDYKPRKDGEDKTHVSSKSKKSSKDKKKEKKKNKKEKKKKKKRNESGSESNQDDSDFAGANDDDDNEGSEDEDGLDYSDEDKNMILRYFNKFKLEELQSLITSKKLDTVISLRPFHNFGELRNKLKSKNLVQLIISMKEALDARDIVDALFTKCEDISKRMQSKVESLIKSEEDGSKNKDNLEVKYQPKNLNKALSLKPYQLIGLNWLCLMHKEKLNAILADEMGLGKTCQTIAFLAHLVETSPRMLHLIVVPPSTLDNWVREITTWCPQFYFTVYQGSLDERRSIRASILNDDFERPLNAILTTYTMLISTNDDKAFFKKLNIGYVIYDEAHMLKNMNSIRYQGLIKIKSKGKLLLTGTPLQNNLVELMSLLYFVMPDMFHHKIDHIKQVFGFSARQDADKDWFYKDKIEQAKGIMRPFILRRIKADVLKQLPRKTEEIVYCDMTRRQEKEYTSLITFYKKRKDELLKELEAKKEAQSAREASQTSTPPLPSSSSAQLLQEINDIVASGSSLGTKKTALEKKKEKEKSTEDSTANIIMELRKTANHPLLRRVIYDDETVKKMAKIITKEQSGDTVLDYVIEDLSVMNDFQIHKLCPLYKGLKGFELKNEQILDSGKFIILDSLLEEKKDLGQKVLVFSQFVIALDILEEFMKLKNYKYLRLDGSTPVNERQDLIDCFNHDNEVFVFLLSTKAGGMGINLTAASVVILHDIDYNPYNDKQAEDRCHRVGQTKEVQVYKLLSKNTIDETMLKIQQRKINLGLDISGENDEKQSKADMVSLLKEALKI